MQAFARPGDDNVPSSASDGRQRRAAEVDKFRGAIQGEFEQGSFSRPRTYSRWPECIAQEGCGGR